MLALDYDFGIIYFSANDAGYLTGDEYKAGAAALIAEIRRAAGWDIPLVLVGCPLDPQGALDATMLARENVYPGCLYEIAQATGGTMFINLRRITDESGLSAARLAYGPWASYSDWDTGEDYVVGNIVRVLEVVPSYLLYRCIANHTSAAANVPPHSGYWYEVAPDFHDDIHYSFSGARHLAKLLVRTMLGIDDGVGQLATDVAEVTAAAGLYSAPATILGVPGESTSGGPVSLSTGRFKPA